MFQVSSKSTRFYKYWLPIVWCLVILGAGGLAASQQATTGAKLAVVTGLVAIFSFGFFMFKLMIWDLADEVFDCQDFFLVRTKGKEVKIFLHEISNLSYSYMTNPNRVLLTLRTPIAEIGTEVSFALSHKFRLRLRDDRVDQWIRRIDEARIQHFRNSQSP